MQEHNQRINQLELLNNKPGDGDYRVRPDGLLYLPLEYYRATADRVFGQGRWQAHHDSSSLRFEVFRHPVTGKVVGEACYLQTTVTAEGFMPHSATGYAPVQFARDKTSREIGEEQQVGVYTLAIRAAEARGLKDALANYGPAFVADLEGQKEKRKGKEGQGGKAATSQSPAKPRLEVVKGAGEKGNHQEPQAFQPDKAEDAVPVTPTNPADPWEEGRGEATSGPSLITPEQLEQVKKLAEEKGYRMSGVEEASRRKFGVALGELTREQAEEVIASLVFAKGRKAA